MSKVELNIVFKPTEDEWEFGMLTTDILVLYYLIPEHVRRMPTGWIQFEYFRFWDLCSSFSQKDVVHLDYRQGLVFLDGIDAISKLLLDGDEKFCRKIFDKVVVKTARFKSLDQFREYYLHYASELLASVKKIFSRHPDLFPLYENNFQLQHHNCSYDEWVDRNVIMH